MSPLLKKIIVSLLWKFNILHFYSPKMAEELQFIKDKKIISKIPRYIAGSFSHNRLNIKFSDSASFLFMYNEIFEKQIYNFKTNSDKPFIIDCGANIGLSIIYFKQLYPAATILGFEPDPGAFEILTYNIKQLGFFDVEVMEKGLWDKETRLSFFAEGADGGRIALESDKENLKHIYTVRLKDYLNKHVDFLKIDIEGAETTVLYDCADSLRNVDRIFIEYHSFLDQKQELHKLLKVLLETGFRYNIQHIGSFSPSPYLKINSYLKMDNQLNIFAYR